MHRREIINKFAKNKNMKKYLELGLQNPDTVFNHVNCEIKHSVDINDSFASYTMSTDEFFQKLNNDELDISKDYQWDLIFIDANHLGNFVKNDLINSLTHLSDNGFIFLHDVLPKSYKLQLEYGGCQTAWKVIPYLLKNHPEIHVCTVDENTEGVGIVFKNNKKTRKLLDKNYNIFYEYYIMDKDRKTSQNRVEIERLDEWINNPTYIFNEEDISHKTNMYKDHWLNNNLI